MACSEWKVPCAPVKPWQMTRVSELTRTDMSGGLSLDGIDDLLGRIGKIVSGQDGKPRVSQDALAHIDVGAFQPHHQRNMKGDFAGSRNDALGDHVAAHDAAEDVDQDAFDVLV